MEVTYTGHLQYLLQTCFNSLETPTSDPGGSSGYWLTPPPPSIDTVTEQQRRSHVTFGCSSAGSQQLAKLLGASSRSEQRLRSPRAHQVTCLSINHIYRHFPNDETKLCPRFQFDPCHKDLILSTNAVSQSTLLTY